MAWSDLMQEVVPWAMAVSAHALYQYGSKPQTERVKLSSTRYTFCMQNVGFSRIAVVCTVVNW